MWYTYLFILLYLYIFIITIDIYLIWKNIGSNASVPDVGSINPEPFPRNCNLAPVSRLICLTFAPCIPINFVLALNERSSIPMNTFAVWKRFKIIIKDRYY